MEGYIWFFISDSKLERQFGVNQEKKNELLGKSSHFEDVQVVPALTLGKRKWNVDVGCQVGGRGACSQCSHFGANWCPREIVSGASKSDQSGVQ